MHPRLRTRAADAALRVGTAETIAALGLGVLFLAPLLIYGPFDTEEAALGVFASQLHYRELLRGNWVFWLDSLGFGTPMPIGHRLDLHPVFAVAAVSSLRVALSLLWMVHVAAMAVYFLRLAAVSGIRAPVRLALLACYLFSAVSVCLFFQTDWVSCVVAWSLYPVLVFYLRQAIRGEAISRFWVASLRLALLLGVWVLNSHPGYVAPLAVALAVYALAAAPPRAAVYGCLCVAVVLTAAVSAERLYFVVTEMQLFPAGLPRNVQTGYRLSDYASAAIAPFASFSMAMRLPFIGLVVGIAALASLVRLPRLDPHLRGCAIAFAAAALFSLVPQEVVSDRLAVSGLWLFRDPMVFFGLLAGGAVLQRVHDGASPWRRNAVVALLTVQVLQQAATIWPGLQRYWRNRYDLGFYRHQLHPFGLSRLLTEHASAFGRRVYLSPAAQTLARGALSHYGVHTVTDLVLQGLAPVNAWFKGVSMDRLYPSEYLMHGRILGQREVIENRRLLDVLGIALVLTTEREELFSGLDLVSRTHVRTLRGEDDLLLFANADAWPRAVLMQADAGTLRLPLRPGCRHAAALCRDYAPLAQRRLHDRVTMTTGNGRYTVHVAASERERLLFLSATYRPEWRATSPHGALRVDSVADAFVGVAVPPGVTELEIAFVPTARIVLTWFCGLTMLAMLLTFVIVLRRGGVGAAAPVALEA